MIIAIDGPAGSGKSSTARQVAHRLGFRHLDSGAFYRAITLAALERGLAPERWPLLDASELNDLHVYAVPVVSAFEFFIGDRNVTDEIRSPDVNSHVSQMAAVPAVREWLLGQLREAGKAGQLVADGRDIGTVVFPGADLKIFLVAQSETRARRRLAEMGVHDPSTIEVQNEIDRLGRRDQMDSQRATAPLRRAEDAVIVDTTRLSFEEQVDRIVGLARRIQGEGKSS